MPTDTERSTPILYLALFHSLMKILYLDCFSGISGDMAVGALVDAGVPLSVLRDGLALLGFDESVVRLETRAIMRSQIRATKLDVIDVAAHGVGASGDHKHAGAHDAAHGHVDEMARSHDHAHDHAHSHEHDHAHEHSHGHSHLHEHTHGDAHAHDHRSYADIRRLIESSDLPAGVKRAGLAIFREIAIAEARIHDTDLDAVHFHEVGAVDSIADVVAFALCLDHLDIGEVYSSAIPLGSGGFVTTQHGTMPLPAPATLEILKGYPTQLTGVPFELTTPTGAGIIKAMSRGTLALDVLTIERVGFGGGTRELADRPNLLRAMIGERVSTDERDEVTVIECNIDDLNPQIYPHLFERLLEAGANDVFLTPVLMKKGRPGHVLSVLATSERIEHLTQILFAETTTIGVRYSDRRRRKLARRDVVVETEYGPVRMKRVDIDGAARTSPELEEARRIASERALPLQSVLRRLQEIAASNDLPAS
jgi:pyridinium-3,5-bisthiocarboxylic acid mononucleotide nickel chelatase